MASKITDELFRTMLLASLRDARPEDLKKIFSENEDEAHTALRGHNDRLSGRMRGTVDQLAVLTQGARSHRAASGKSESAPPQRNKKQKPFDEATDRVRKIFASADE